MRIETVILGIATTLAVLGSGVAFAWNIQEEHDTWDLIRCGDGSNSTVGQSDGGWTVITAGKNGTAGGQFATVGQAALAGCGE